MSKLRTQTHFGSEKELSLEELIAERIPEREKNQLEAAYSAAATIEQRQFFATSEVIKFIDPDKLSGLNLKRKSEEITGEINYLQQILKGDFKRTFEVFHGDGAIMTLSEDCVQKMKEKVKENEVILKRGIEILKGWKAICDGRLALLKVKQFKTRTIPKHTEELHEQMDRLLTNIVEQVKNSCKKVEGFQAEMNRLSNEFARDNIDPSVNLPTFGNDKRIQHLKDFMRS
jgi:hypothetical protein